MSYQLARGVGPAGIDVAFERFGKEDSTPVLLIMGVGGQLIAWHQEFIQLLVERGTYCIRFDNRDVGLSTHFHDAPTPDLPGVLSGNYSSVSYTLSDMAADAAGLLDVLGLDSAHIVGASMGGYIAQTLAIERPDRVRSLTSIMSTTGDMSVGQPSPDAMSIFALPAPTNRNEAMDNAVAALKVIGSPAYEVDESATRENAGLAYDRCYDPAGVARQAIASVASGDRTEKLRSLATPTLVIHGDSDKMCDVSGGNATAEAIPNAQLKIIEGMGHNFPRELWPLITSSIADHIATADT